MGLAVVMIIITIISVVVPAATGLYGAVGAATVAAGASSGVCQLAVFGVQALIAVGAGLIFMGIEEAVTAACPEFEEWNSKYWYVSLIVFVVCAASTAIITSGITNVVFKASFRVITHIFGGYAVFQVSADLAAEVYGGMCAIGSGAARIVGLIARGLGVAFSIAHLDDWVINGIITGTSQINV